ncbi:FecCD family ABC transporter permease [Desulfoplanes formicivorans]|uniref:Iron ABC transporter permease n=1 Tax=Desulfoplanes formicivorans TaxID=1592317 RepID=A0A194ADJ2_9BACT|nr:iron ABC transporter permease [Desulfoplanes formicivorans]GAU07413.1 iron ABC transporter permease [Desulfoplanes formicivorans]
MHLEDGHIPAEYSRYIGRKVLLISATGLLLAGALLTAISLGAAHVPMGDVAKSLLSLDVSRRIQIIVWEIRLPQALSAIIAGGGLAISGAVMQSILRNPLGSPFTLGISHAAAFGAAFSVMLLGSGVMGSSQVGSINITNPYLTTTAAFVCSLAATAMIIAVSRLRGATPETMILTGVALGALFTAGTMFLQFFADDVQLAAMVFWTFGDTARASWNEIALLAGVTGVASVYFLANGWNYNAIDAGDETARGLGVRVDRLRVTGMLMASLVTSVIIAYLGIIGFVGLVVPHMARRILGGDHRFLLPATLFLGALLLLVSDTAARLMLAPHVLPVSVLTAFMGAPLFMYLILRGYK